VPPGGNRRIVPDRGTWSETMPAAARAATP
jgi:hypothetical protein